MSSIFERLMKKFQKDFEDEKAEEVARTRDAIVRALKSEQASLPAAVFALRLVEWELMRSQVEEFMGHVQIPKGSVPLASPAASPAEK